MGRLFFFGCSYTQYGWPTWANVIGYDQGVEYHNFGIAGLGNVGILHRMIEANAKLKFKDDDKILILWSSWSREDRVRKQNWVTTGSVFNSGNPEYNNYFIKRYWSFDNDVVKNATAIHIANQMFGKNIYWQGSAFDFATNEAFATSFDLNSQKLVDFYLQLLPDVPVYHFEINEDDRKPFGIIQDCHPDPVTHMNIVKDWLYPQLGLELKESTIEVFTNLNKDIAKHLRSVYRPSIEKTIDYTHKLITLKYSTLYDNCIEHYNIIDNV